MNNKNFEYLRDQVKFTGFGEGLESDLKVNLQKEPAEFTLFHNTKFGNDQVDSALHFRKSDQTDMYFFNSYQVQMKNDHAPNTMEQTFYINKSNNITLKEAYNLMNGRSVNKDLTNKEDQVYNAWVQMDFKQTDERGNFKMKQFHQNYGYDLGAALGKHPIKELTNDTDKTRLLESLQKGNLQSVTFEREGKEQKHFIEANPQFKTINIYDSKMQRVTKQDLGEKEGKGEKDSVKQDKKESQKTGSDDEEGGSGGQKSNTKKKRKQHHSI